MVQPPSAPGERWTRFDNPAAVALDYLNRWRIAVLLQVERSTATPQGVRRFVEGDLLIISLTNLRRAARFAMNAVQEGSAAYHRIGGALGDFDSAVPGLQNMRNMVEHFDEYERGTGDAQQRGGRNRRTPGPLLAEQFSVDYVSAGDGVLRLGDNQLSIDGVSTAARQLFDRVYSALRDFAAE
jgi:hypothetical protein